MPDEILQELWRVKDAIAREHRYDIDALVAHLKAINRPEGVRIVDLSEDAAMVRSRPGGSCTPHECK